MKQGLSREELRLVAQATFNKTADIGFRHAQENLPFMKHTILDAARSDGRRGESAIVVSAGPSLHRRKSLQTIKDHGYDGTIVAADGALGHCLRNGVIPDYVVTVDPHPSWIIRWFGDPELQQRPDDDYFRRQDLDPALNSKETERNRELIDLVNRYGPRIKVIIATCVAPNVTKRCLDAGMTLYWWNPICDDYDDPASHTRKLNEMTDMPCMVTGGNCGAAAWIFANAILQRPAVAVVGMDLGYPPGTPLKKTQYYHELIKFYSEADLERAYIEVPNPHLNETWYTDPTYYWYRQCFQDVVHQSGWTTYNCTEGGTLFGDGIIWMTLDRFIDEQKGRGSGQASAGRR